MPQCTTTVITYYLTQWFSLWGRWTESRFLTSAVPTNSANASQLWPMFTCSDLKNWPLFDHWSWTNHLTRAKEMLMMSSLILAFKENIKLEKFRKDMLQWQSSPAEIRSGQCSDDNIFSQELSSYKLMFEMSQPCDERTSAVTRPLCNDHY